MVTQWSAADVASCRVVPINQYVTFSFRTQFERPPICLHQQSRTPTVKHRHSILPRKVLFVHQEPDPSTKESPASDSNGIFLSLFSSSSSSPSSPLSWSSSFYSFLPSLSCLLSSFFCHRLLPSLMCLLSFVPAHLALRLRSRPRSFEVGGPNLRSVEFRKKFGLDCCSSPGYNFAAPRRDL